MILKLLKKKFHFCSIWNVNRKFLAVKLYDISYLVTIETHIHLWYGCVLSLVRLPCHIHVIFTKNGHMREKIISGH